MYPLRLSCFTRSELILGSSITYADMELNQVVSFLLLLYTRYSVSIQQNPKPDRTVTLPFLFLPLPFLNKVQAVSLLLSSFPSS